jgi:hypothetical protein
MFMMIGLVLVVGLIALKRHLSVMLGWTLGVAVTIPVFTVSGDITDVTAAGALAGPLVAAVFLAVDMWWTIRRRSAAPGPAAPGAMPPSETPATTTSG